ncbi:zinc ribbon domain-containing protein [Desulfitobacterium sp. THU1]|uniref:zinc ribbon domain-containing protein n=1 Tax=Desulfitobacterium sp. THU1 TaxID=3138072 RepID=UPI00311DE19D
MANDLFGGLNVLMKGLSGFMPQDDPEVKVMNAQSDLSDLRKQETELYAEIGRQLLSKNSGQFPELETKLKLVQANLTEAQSKLEAAQAEKMQKEQAEQLTEEKCTCPECGYRNLENIKFCQECGAKLGASNCRQCGVALAPGTRFCGECGARQEA